MDNKLLSGMNIVMIVSGSISAYRTPDIVRDLIKSGASVRVILSKAASRIIGKQALEWASEQSVIEELTGNMEHINLFAENREKTVLLVCPATYNMVGKMANGIADDPSGTVFANAIGSHINTVIVPAMHMEMYDNPIMGKNLKILEELGVKIVSPRIEDGKAKIMWSDEIIDTILRKKSRGKTILIISGRSDVKIDPVRSLVNRSTGYTGVCMAREAYRNGYDNIIYLGNSDYRIPHYCEYINCSETDDFYSKAELIIRSRKIDLITIPAALSDFSITPSEKKIKSDFAVEIPLNIREKLIDLVVKIMKELNLKVPIIRFKLTDEEYSPKDRGQITVVDNASENPFGIRENRYTIYDGNKRLLERTMTKEELASILLRIGEDTGE
ncbi:MAG: bifunctional phosphopantothenoylcysteine decarboxylase/phosphopantothenate--cysteine ligase CoaBC [Cuniculiplasma sp.]